MPQRPRRRSASAVKLAELALAVPQVVGHRVARMAAAGPWPGARDRREFHAMGAEKISAFNESWLAMAMQAWRAQWALATSMASWWWLPARGGWSASRGPRPGLMPWPQGWQRWSADSARVLDHGLAPVHRRAMANAKRLGRLKK